MDNLDSMRVFAHAARTGNFSETGRQLGVAPSSVSRQVNALEDALGVRLLHRTTRKIHLTDAGQIYLEQAERILADVDEVNRTVAEMSGTPRGVLRVTVPVVFGQVKIACLLRGFLERYPEVHVELFASDQNIDLVQDGFDVAVRIGKLDDSTLIARRITPMERHIYASPEYLARCGTPASPDDLAEHNCITFRFFVASNLWRAGGGTWRLEAPGGEEVALEVSGNMEANNAQVLLEAAVSGLGLVLLPEWMTEAHVARGELQAVLADYRVSPFALDSAVYAVYPSSRHLSPKVRAFVDYLVEHLGREQV